MKTIFTHSLYLVITFFILKSNNLISQSNSDLLQSEVISFIKTGEYQKAQTLLESNENLLSTDTNGLFDLIVNLYLFNSKWDNMIQIYSNRNKAIQEDTTMLSLARYYKSFATENMVSFSSSIPYKPSASGTPIIPVKLNGKLYHFWFDTGAGMSVVSSDVAQSCGIKWMNNTNSSAQAATGKQVGVSPGMIDSLQIDKINIYHHPCLILDKKDLEFKILGIRVLKIDGIIGWNFIQNMDVTINDQNHTISLEKWDHSSLSGNNFFWQGQPIIQAQDSTSLPLLFFIDTGANTSGVYQQFLNKSDLSKFKRKNMMIGSAGGMKKIAAYVIPQLKIKVENKTLTLKNISSVPESGEKLIEPDGVLGINEFKKSIIHFNIRKGYFKIN